MLSFLVFWGGGIVVLKQADTLHLSCAVLQMSVNNRHDQHSASEWMESCFVGVLPLEKPF